MKATSAVIGVIFLVLADARAEKPECHLDPDSGPCEAYMPMHYYNAFTGECHEFVYGGCQGNDNRFGTEEECLDHCAAVRNDRQVDCKAPADRGPCKGLIRRYFYDPSAKSCSPFDYGGCQGNHNNFKTFDECMIACFGV